jgi:hypothetical protein
MSSQDPSQTSALPVSLGFCVATATLFVLALLAQLGLRLVTRGELELGLGFMAFCILFYVVATFVAFGTEQRLEHPSFVVKNVAVQAGFLGAGWLLCLRQLPLAWLGRSIAFSLVLHAAAHLFAALRTQLTRELLQRPAVTQADALQRAFDTRANNYLALPLGAALGTLLGALTGAPRAEIVRHGLAGVSGAVAALALAQLLAGWLQLARDFVSLSDSSSAGRLALQVSALPRSYRLQLVVPAASAASVDLAQDAASLSAAVRRVWLVNQLQPIVLFTTGALLVWQLELATLPGATMMTALFALCLLLTQLPYALGQRTTNAHVRAHASVIAPPVSWLACLGALLLGALAALCLGGVLLGLLSQL